MPVSFGSTADPTLSSSVVDTPSSSRDTHSPLLVNGGSSKPTANGTPELVDQPAVVQQPVVQPQQPVASTSHAFVPVHTALNSFERAGAESLYNAYVSKTYSDVEVNVAFLSGGVGSTPAETTGFSFSLHRIILARSPLFARLLRQPPSPSFDGRTLHLTFSDPLITFESFSLALAFLYHPSTVIPHISATDTRAVLATAVGLELEALAEIAGGLAVEELRREAMSEEGVERWARFVDARALVAATDANGRPQTPSSTATESNRPNGKGPASSLSGASDGTGTTNSTTGTGAEEGPLLYGEYALKLRAELLEALIVAAPPRFGAFASAAAAGVPRGEGEKALARLYARLPFELFKIVVESRRLPVEGDQERFNFGKLVVSLRKKRFAALSASSPAGAVFEETVVLAFGAPGSAEGQEGEDGAAGGGGAAVNVLRKMRRRALWKVSGGGS